METNLVRGSESRQIGVGGTTRGRSSESLVVPSSRSCGILGGPGRVTGDRWSVDLRRVYDLGGELGGRPSGFS